MIGGKINRDLTPKEQTELFKTLDLVSAAEVAELLGWRVQKVSTYAERGVLPKPIGRINERPVWTRQQIERYKNSRGHS